MALPMQSREHTTELEKPMTGAPSLNAGHTDAATLVRSDPRLAALLPFSGLPDVQTAEILAQATVRRFQAQEPLFNEGDPADNFFVQLSGALKIVRTSDGGAQVIVFHIAPGDLFGIARALGNTCFQTTATALSPGLALGWSSEVWDRFVDRVPGFRSAARTAVGSRISELQDRLMEISTLQVETRIARALVRLVDKHGQQTAAGVEIDFPITRQDMAEIAGTTLHSVSRHLSGWQKAGILESGRRRVVIKAVDRLPIRAR